MTGSDEYAFSIHQEAEDDFFNPRINSNFIEVI